MSYEFDLDIQLETTVDLYGQDRASHWKDASPDEKVFFEQSERFARFLTDSSNRFYVDGQIDDDLGKFQFELLKFLRYDDSTKEDVQRILNDITSYGPSDADKIRAALDLIKEHIDDMPDDPEDKESPLRLVWESLCESYAWDLVGRIKDCARRTIQLYELTLSMKPHRTTLSFLLRLSRCYIYGFEPECIILCRSIIDTAFREAIPDSLCEKHYPKRKPDDTFGLAIRIVTANNEGIIDGDIRRMAFLVKERGDKAVHYQPDITTDVLGTIKDSITVMESLY